MTHPFGTTGWGRVLVRGWWTRSIAICVAVVALACSPPSADAGTYNVTGCRTSWVPDVRNTSGPYVMGTFDQCDEPDVRWLYASFANGRINAGDYVGWRFDAPANTAIVSASIRWRGRGDWASADWGLVDVSLVASNSAQVLERRDAFDTTDTISMPDAQWVRAYVLCHAQSGSTCRGNFIGSGDLDNPRLSILRSTVTISDRLAPVVRQIAGPALSDVVWTDSKPLAFSASDEGSGLFRLDIAVDGRTVSSVPAVADDRCVDHGARDFSYAVPCPTQASGTVSIDTASLPSGQHTVAVDLEDAAGNRTALIPPTPKLIVNDHRAVGYFANGSFFNPRFAAPRVANGVGATSDARISAAFVRQVGKGRSRHSVRARKRQVRFAQRPTVKGTLTAPSGEPIADATVFIGQQPEGQQWRLDGAVRTDSAGDFVYRPAARHPNRKLRAVYFPFSDSHENVVSDPLDLRVRAGLTLHVDRHRLRNGQRLVFTGRVLGALPAQGIAVTLQAKVGRHYRSFRQLRASSGTGGRIRTAYRFERTTRPARYRFRLKVVRQAGLPFQGGTSPVVAVSVHP
jgi:hypothetical protein